MHPQNVNGVTFALCTLQALHSVIQSTNNAVVPERSSWGGRSRVQRREFKARADQMPILGTGKLDTMGSITSGHIP
jgi:hypothetical protein